MLEKVKLALRITTDAFDEEIEDLIDAAIADLEQGGVIVPDVPEDDGLCRMAIITFVRMRFGEPSDYDRLNDAYWQQKAQLQTTTNYTEWSGCNGQIRCDLFGR